MTGTEDLGGGLQAFFKLENGFKLNNGALGNNGALFGRQAYVGLKSDRYGEVRMGRQYDLSFESLVSFSASGKFAGASARMRAMSINRRHGAWQQSVRGDWATTRNLHRLVTG